MTNRPEKRGIPRICVDYRKRANQVAACQFGTYKNILQVMNLEI